MRKSSYLKNNIRITDSDVLNGNKPLVKFLQTPIFKFNKKIYYFN